MAIPATQAHAGFAGLIGVARADISPPPGIYCRAWGAALHDTPAGLHRPLTCTALTLRETTAGGAPLALVALDLGWWKNPDDERLVREAVLAALGVDESRVIVALSHTHAGPSICRAEADRPGGHLIAGYLDLVRDAAASCARQALAGERAGVLEWAYGRCSLARNRDLPDPARERIICGFNPTRPADDTLLVGRACDAASRPIATVVNYACHPTTLAWENHLISPDWVGAMRETVEAATGGAPCVFLQGASGELAPRDQYVGDAAVADANGRQVGYSALATLTAMLPPATELAFAGAIESGAPLAAWRARDRRVDTTLAARRIDIAIELKPLPSVAELEARLTACADRVQSERLRRAIAVRRMVGDGATCATPAWAWSVGGALLLAHPNEAYSWLQGELRRRAGDAPVVVMGLANGAAAGYLPPRELYALDIYQVWQSPFAAGCLERFAEACATTLADLSASTVTA